jgi:hypothetical protein
VGEKPGVRYAEEVRLVSPYRRAGQEPCQGVEQAPEGQQIRSRYYPVKSYASCSNDRPWAWCLDKPCIIDKNNPPTAACTCEAVANFGAYVIVTSAYTPATCTTGVISSATVQQTTQVTDFLKTKIKLMTRSTFRCSTRANSCAPIEWAHLADRLLSARRTSLAPRAAHGGGGSALSGPPP